MLNKRARPTDEESKDELLHQLAKQAGLGATKEKLSSGVFETRFIEFVRLALVSGVDSSAKKFDDRYETLVAIVRKNGHKRQIPSAESVRRLVEAANTEKTPYLWSSQEAINCFL